MQDRIDPPYDPCLEQDEQRELEEALEARRLQDEQELCDDARALQEAHEEARAEAFFAPRRTPFDRELAVERISEAA